MTYVLDTNIVLYLLGNKLSEQLPLGCYYVSVITEMELLSSPSLSTEETASIMDFLNDVHVVGITRNVKHHAIRLRRDHRLKLPDAIIAATALSLSSTLLTNDKGLTEVPGLTCQTIPIKL